MCIRDSGIICADYPNALIAARKDSPLIIGCGENENFIASDVTAVISHTRDVIYMEDGEIAVLTAEGVSLFNDEMDPIDKPHSHIDWDVSAAEKGGYPHFMLKEIFEQPEAIRKTVSPRVREMCIRDRPTSASPLSTVSSRIWIPSWRS